MHAMGGCCSTQSTKRASADAPRRGGPTMDAGADTSLSFAQQTNFAYRIGTALFTPSSPAATTNAVISPLSLYAVLSLLAAGAGSGGTQDQFIATLGDGEGAAEDHHAIAEKMVQIVLADRSRAGGPRIAFANGIFVDSALKIKSAFEKVAAGKYRTETRSVDSQNKAAQAVEEVNSWVEKLTSGLVKELLPPGAIDATTELVLGNALYFKGSWAQKFETKEGEFRLLDGSSVQTTFMTSSKDQNISSYHNVKVLRLPYRQGEDRRQFSMYILLPVGKHSIWALAKNLSSQPEFLDRRMPKSKYPVGEFKVPKFKVSFGLEASDLLKDLGLQLPFSAEADLSELAEVGQNLCVSSIFHKSFVEVNEEGSEPAAASDVMTIWICREPTPVDFSADHPFLFLIREDTTGVVLSVGLVTNPLLAP